MIVMLYVQRSPPNDQGQPPRAARSAGPSCYAENPRCTQSGRHFLARFFFAPFFAVFATGLSAIGSPQEKTFSVAR
jgi:hypothetical protein